MRIGSIDSTHFGIYKSQNVTKVGNEEITTVNGIYKDKKISIYTHKTDNKRLAKLYYISDLLGNFIKLKLQKFLPDGSKTTLLKQTKSY